MFHVQIDERQLVLVNLLFLLVLKLTLLVLGYLVVRLGHRLLVAGVTGEFKFRAEMSGARADLASASPGLLFLLLGVLLMGYGLGVSKVIEIDPTSPPRVAAPPAPIPPVGTSLPEGRDE
jgi:hypothetical protein